MTPAEDTTMIELITSKLATKKEVELIQRLLEKAPYSQPLQRLAERHGLENQHFTYKYAAQTEASDRDDEIWDDVMTLALVDIKTKKSKKNSKAKTKAPNQRKNASLETKAKSPKPLVKAKEEKSTKLKQERYSNHQEDKAKISDFTAWINTLKNNTPCDSAKTPLVEAEGSKKKEKKTKSPNKINAKKSKKEKKARKKKKKKSSIKNSQLLSKIKKSIKGKKNPASESLAELYLTQGHPKKAIKTYEKLSLINPEKSDYFAARIDELKKKFK